MSGLFLISMRQILLRPFRSLLTLFSVALGVALFTSIDIVNDSTLRGFSSGIEALSGKAQLSIQGGENGFLESILDEVMKLPEVGSAIPLVETRVYWAENGRIETLTVLGIDLLKESSVRAYRTSSGELLKDPLEFLNQPDSIILTRKFARDHSLNEGDRIRLATAQGTRSFKVRGLLEPEGPATAYGGNLAIMDIDGARFQFGKEGKIDRIDVIPAAGLPLEQVRSALKKRFEPGLEVESPATQADGMRRLVESYQALLQFMGLLALIVGLFLVMNTTTIAIVERRKEFGILRAIGAYRRTLVGLLTLEAFLLGIVGSLLGVLLGKFVAGKTSGMVTQALSHQYLIPVHLQGLDLSASQWIKGVGLGSGVTFAAALLSARAALRIQPLEAVKGMEVQILAGSRGLPWLGAGLLLLLVLDSMLGWSGSIPGFRNLNPFLLIFGSVLTSPGLVRILIRGIRVLLPLPSIRLATDQLLRNPKRTGGNIMTLMSGLMLVIVLGLTNRSIKYSLETWFDRTLAADLVVSSSGKLLSFQVQPLSETLKDELNRLPGVDVSEGTGATALRHVKQRYGGFTLALKAFDPPHPRLRNRMIDLAEGDPEKVLPLFFDPTRNSILVSQNFVLKFKKRTGDEIELATPTGLHRFRIDGIVAEFSNPEGVFYLSRALYKKLWKDSLVSGFFMMAKPGVHPTTVRAQLDSTLGREKGLMATLNTELAGQARSMVDESFAFTRAIEWSALLVGLFGLFNTLLVSVLERTREMAILRAVGMTRRQLFAMVVGEGLIQGLTGGTVAVGIGVFATYFWIIGTLSSLLGWILRFSAPPEALLRVVGFGVLVGVLASLLPAIRVGRQPIQDALAR